jgi:phage major head subunit gpT-like protein
MAQDDDRQVAEATEFWQKLEAMVAAAEDTKKKVAVTHTRILADATLLE